MDRTEYTECLSQYDKLNLDNKEDRRLATYTLEDFFGRILAEVGRQYLEFDENTTSQNIKQQWFKARDYLNSLEGTKAPERYSSVISRLAETRNRVAHNYEKNPPIEPLKDAREIAEEWANWILDTAERYPTREAVWYRWATEHGLDEDPVPLFTTDENGVVQVADYGHRSRPVLSLHRRMKETVRTEAKKVIQDYENGTDNFEGVHTMMYWIEDDEIVPLYNSWSAKTSRGGDSLNVMLERIETSMSHFCKWGYIHLCHTGGLSVNVIDEDFYEENEVDKSGKYENWAETLFEPNSRQLRQPVYFWSNATKLDEEVGLPGIYSDLFRPHEVISALGNHLYPDKNLDRVSI